MAKTWETIQLEITQALKAGKIQVAAALIPFALKADDRPYPGRKQGGGKP
jgi:hypothetical protein